VSARALVAVALGLTFAGPVLASDVGYIYGRVETDNGQKYVGQLRWGDEESFWGDYFNGFKEENPWAAHVPPRWSQLSTHRWSMPSRSASAAPGINVGISARTASLAESAAVAC